MLEDIPLPFPFANQIEFENFHKPPWNSSTRVNMLAFGRILDLMDYNYIVIKLYKSKRFLHSHFVNFFAVFPLIMWNYSTLHSQRNSWITLCQVFMGTFVIGINKDKKEGICTITECWNHSPFQNTELSLDLSVEFTLSCVHFAGLWCPRKACWYVWLAAEGKLQKASKSNLYVSWSLNTIHRISGFGGFSLVHPSSISFLFSFHWRRRIIAFFENF